MDDIIRDFLLESYENLDRLDGDLMALERGQSTGETVGAIFRTVHTIKGTCGFLGLPILEKIAHRGENVLSLLRDGKLTVNAEITDALLRTVDAIRRVLAHIETHGTEGEQDNLGLIAVLEEIASGKKKEEALSLEPEPEPESVDESEDAVADPEVVAEASDTAAPSANDEGDPPTAEAEQPDAVGVPAAPAPVAATPTPVAAPPAPALPAAPAAEVPAPKAEAVASRSGVADTAIRVDVQLLDHVMNLVGELVLARNQILQFAPSIKDSGFANASARLNLLTTELQEGVMKTRMQPIGNAWNKLPRLVRDLTRASGKQVLLELEGAETELDRTIIEAIKDPLTHAVRNSVDHGVEDPSVRKGKGKAAEGRLCLRAYHEGGQVNIEISDDGAGLDIEKIRNRAVERGLVPRDRASTLSDREVSHLIFHPGFSTAQKITNVSGRGVGMDVVKTNIERIGGSVDVSSQHGRGTTLRIKIPLTLAIIPALIVLSRGQRYAIPQVSLLELVRLDGGRKDTAIERLYGTALYRLRGDLLPLVFLHECLKLPEPDTDDLDAINIVVLQAGDQQFGLVVDAISDTEEIVVKPLGKELKGIDAFAGATIMGDGQVALIIDVLGVGLRAELLSNGHTSDEGVDLSPVVESGGTPKQSLLLFNTGSARMAIPLAMVARLEEIPARSIEPSGSGPVVQYRNCILPLLDLTGKLQQRMANDDDGTVNMIVYEEGGTRVGIVVEQILDAVEQTIDIRHDVQGAGCVGSAVIEGKVTDLLDLEGLIDSIATRQNLRVAA